MELESKTGSSKTNTMDDSNCDSVQRDKDNVLEGMYNVTSDLSKTNDLVTSIPNEFQNDNIKLLELSKTGVTSDMKLVDSLSDLSLLDKELPNDESNNKCTPEDNTAQHVQAQPLQISETDEASERNKTEKMEKETILAYTKEAELRAEAKRNLRERNQTPQRPEDSKITKLDSSLKKNTAFVRKLRNFTAPQLEGLLKDMSTLNLSKYISEVASALVEAKLKLNDVPAAVMLCSEMHSTYSEFSKVLLEHWVKILSIKKDEKIPNPSKLRVDLRFYGDLIISGIFQYKEALPLLGSILTMLTTSDREEHNNISIILSFCKHCGEDYAGLCPRSMRILSEKYVVPITRSIMLPPEKQRNVRSLLKDYYGSLCKHLLKEHSEMQAFERQNRKILQTKGELSAERKERGDALTASFQKLNSGMINLAEALDEDLPVLPEESIPTRPNTSADECFGTHKESVKGDNEMLSVGITVDLEDGTCSVSLWEDEETERFYTEFPNLKDYLPNFKVEKSEVAAVEVITEEKLDEELKEEELEDDKKEEEADVVTAEDVDEPENSASSSNKGALDAFLSLLQNCVNREMIDNAAIEFLMYHNTKHHRKKLVKVLFGVPRTRLDLLPFYARLVAILHPICPDVATDLGVLLKHDFKYHVRKKDQINIESKVKVIRFISELVKFELYSKFDGLYCLKILLHDFTHHHIEMACTMLETCGRFFFRSADTHHRTKVYLEQIMRMKAGKTLDSRYVTMIENAYYFVNPPESTVTRVKVRPVLHEFIRHILYQDLTKPSEASRVLELMRRLDWKDQNVFNYAVKCLTHAWNVPYPNIKDLANLLAGLVEFQEPVATHVVDGVLEDIRIGLESNAKTLNQRRVGMVKYLGELYNYRMVESSDIFKVLYTLIAFGVSLGSENPSPIDPPDHLFRIRLVCTLLDTCGQYFSHGLSKVKLDYFFIYFQHYYWLKYSDPIWTVDNPFPTGINHMFRDCLTNLRPTIKLAESMEEAKEALDQLNEKMRAKWSPYFSSQSDNEEAGAVAESLTETDGENGEDKYDNLESTQDEWATDEEDSEYERAGARALEPDEDIGNRPGTKLIDREVDESAFVDHPRNDWTADDYLEMDSENDLSDNQNSRSHSPEDDEFLKAFEKMVSENLTDRMKENVKPQHVDIPVPLHVKSNSKKTYEQLQEPEKEEKETVNFVVMLRKGNKQQYKNVAVPTDSELALNLRFQEKAERVEMEKVKKLTLDINDRLEEEDYQDQLSQAQKPAIINLNRERRHKYQHPKGAPDADLIFGRKKIQR